MKPYPLAFIWSRIGSEKRHTKENVQLNSCRLRWLVLGWRGWDREHFSPQLLLCHLRDLLFATQHSVYQFIGQRRYLLITFSIETTTGILTQVIGTNQLLDYKAGRPTSQKIECFPFLILSHSVLKLQNLSNSKRQFYPQQWRRLVTQEITDTYFQYLPTIQITTQLLSRRICQKWSQYLLCFATLVLTIYQSCQKYHLQYEDRNI